MLSLSVLGCALSAAHFFTAVVGAPLNPRDDAPKVVFAHHMVGNTFPYALQDWVDDINLAHAYGIDAFALNIGSDSWQSARVQDAYTAAQQTGTGFKLFLSFDMSSLPCSSPNDAATLRNYITHYASHPNQFKYNNKVFVSTFSGENCFFGQGSVVQGWSSQFLGQLTGANSVFFVPSFFVDPSTFASGGWLSIMDGGFNWNSAWPTDATPSNLGSLASKEATKSANTLQGSSSSQLVQNLVSSLGNDVEYTTALQGKTYLAGVSPWFFTHYSPQTYNKNWVYLSDNLYASRWNALVQSRDSIPMVEVITWNDYGESHYIGPIKGAQPNSQAWVNGFDHQAWLHLTKYFATAYKTGSFPTITNDAVYVWARPHPKNANAPDSVGKPANFEVLEDSMFAVVLATQGGTLQLNSHSFTVPAGFSQYSIPLSPGDTMHATLIRNGATVVDVHPSGYSFNANPPSYNYNAFVAMGCSGGSC